MKLLRRIKKDIDQDKEGEDVPKLESVEVVLVHCNLGNNFYQNIQLNQNMENMLKTMAFYHLQENLDINMVKN